MQNKLTSMKKTVCEQNQLNVEPAISISGVYTSEYKEWDVSFHIVYIVKKYAPGDHQII